MKLETFKASKWAQRYQYKSFEPFPVDHEWLWEDPVINTLLEQANRALGELNAFSLIMPRHRPVYTDARRQGSPDLQPD